LAASFMMNKSLRGGGRESSSKADYGFRRVRRIGHRPGLRISSGHLGGRHARKKRAAVSGGF
jgi:hypothetical protein